MLELNRLYLGDCLDLMRYIEDKAIDFTLSDIPYDAVNRKDNGLRKLDKAKSIGKNCHLKCV